MKVLTRVRATHFTLTLLAGVTLFQHVARADVVTDWNKNGVLAIKGASSDVSGTAGNALNSNLGTRILAVEHRAIYDAINTISPIKSGRYYYYRNKALTNRSQKSASAAAAQAAHDVLVALIPVTPTSKWSATAWASTQAWLDAKLASDLAALGVTSQDPGIVAGQAAAAAAIAARSQDGSTPSTTYFPVLVASPATIINTPTATISATVSVGAGLWRPTNSAAGDVSAVTGAPTGFVAGVIQPQAGIDYNWPSVTPFSLSADQQDAAFGQIPSKLNIQGAEYRAELSYVLSHGQEISSATQRTNDQLLQALYYKLDAEIFAFETARIASAARGLDLKKNAQLFALLANAQADGRVVAWASKYSQSLWRPIDAINYSVLTNPTTDAITSFSWKPLAATPSHPSNTSGHSTTISAATQVLRSFFRSDLIAPKGETQVLTTLGWLTGTNNGTGQVDPNVFGGTATTRSVQTFSDVQLETGRSRVFLGVHFPNDDYQGQTLGLTVADLILTRDYDPASVGVSPFIGRSNVASQRHLENIFIKATSTGNYGWYGLSN
jgi:hypothetical protein